MRHEEIVSPVTGKTNVALLREVDVSEICRLYRDGVNINVERYFKDLSFVHLYKCKDSGFMFYEPREIAGDSAFYEEISGVDWYYQKEKWEFDEVAKLLAPGMTVLEAGAGEGIFMEKLIRRGIVCEGLDFNQEAITKAAGRGLQIHNCGLDRFASTHKNSYDAFCAFQVLEHVSDVKTFLLNAVEILKPGGLLILSVPNNSARFVRLDEELYLNMPPHHVGLWTEKAFRSLTGYLPLKMVSITFEPLSKPLIPKFYRIWILSIRKKYGFWGKVLDKLLYPNSVFIFNMFRKKILGQSMIVVFKKV